MGCIMLIMLSYVGFQVWVYNILRILNIPQSVLVWKVMQRDINYIWYKVLGLEGAHHTLEG